MDPPSVLAHCYAMSGPKGGGSRKFCPGSGLQEVPEHVLHDPAVAVVVRLARGVDANRGLELVRALSVGRLDLHRHRAGRDAVVQLGDAGDRDRLLTGEPHVVGGLAARELQREHPHADQVGPVDPLVGLRDDRLDAEERRALRRPVARRARAVLLAGEDDEWDALALVVLARLVDARDLTVLGEVAGEAAFGAPGELVAQPDVGEGAADHHLVVASAGAVGVEVALLDAVLRQVATGGGVLLYPTRPGPGVGGDPLHPPAAHPRAPDVRPPGGAGRPAP